MTFSEYIEEDDSPPVKKGFSEVFKEKASSTTYSEVFNDAEEPEKEDVTLPPTPEFEDDPTDPISVLDIAKYTAKTQLQFSSNVVGGMALWLPSYIARFGHVGAQKMVNAKVEKFRASPEYQIASPEQRAQIAAAWKSPEETSAEGEELQQKIYSILPEVTTPGAQAGMEVVQEVFKPVQDISHWVGEKVPDGYPTVRDLAVFFTELAIFHYGAKVGKTTATRLKARIERAKTRKEMEILSEDMLESSKKLLDRGDPLPSADILKQHMNELQSVWKIEDARFQELPPRIEYNPRIHEAPPKAPSAKDVARIKNEGEFNEGTTSVALDEVTQVKFDSKQKAISKRHEQTAKVAEEKAITSYDEINKRVIELEKKSEGMTKEEISRTVPKEDKFPYEKESEIGKSIMKDLVDNEKGHTEVMALFNKDRKTPITKPRREIKEYTEKEQKSIKAVETNAKAEGLSANDYLMKNGMSRQGADVMVGLLNQAYRNRTIARRLKEKHGLLQPLENIDNFMKPVKGEVVINQNPYVPLTESHGAIIRDMKELNDWAIVKGFTTAPTSIESLGLQNLKHVINKRELNIHNRGKELTSRVIALKKKYSNSKHRYDAWVQSMGKTKNGLDALKRMGIEYKEKPVKYDAMNKELEIIYKDWVMNELNPKRKSVGLEPIELMDGTYTPFFTHENFIQKLFGKESGHKSRHASGQVAQVNFDHLQRGKLRKGTKLETDPLQNLNTYGNEMIRFTELADVNAFFKEFVEGKMKDPQTGKEFTLRGNNPEVANFITSLNNSIAGISNMKMPRNVEYALTEINNNVTAATLHFQLSTAIKQNAALLLTNARYGFPETVKGIMETIAQRKNVPIHLSTKLPVRRNTHDASLQQFQLQLNQNKILKAREVGRQAGNYLLGLADYFPAEASWRVAYNSLRKKVKSGELTEAQAVRIADEAMVRMQGSGAASDLSPVQMNVLGKTVFRFQTPTIQQLNFLAKEIVGIKNPDVTKGQALVRTMRYFAGMSAAALLFEDVLDIESPVPNPIGAIMDGLANGDSAATTAFHTVLEAAEILPHGGTLKWGSGIEGPALAKVNELVKTVAGRDILYKDVIPKALEGDQRSQDIILYLLGYLGGVSGTGAKSKYDNARKRGEEGIRALLGSYDPKSTQTGGSLDFEAGIGGLDLGNFDL